MTAPVCRIVTFDPQYRADFARLNYAWITTLFAVEPLDRLILDNPESEIVAQGGEIFFALNDGKVVGTVALKREDAITFELTKMAVNEHERGKGFGKALLDAAVDYARTKRAQHIVLSSHSKLTAAIAMYRVAGFVERNDASNSGYSRCNIFMQKDL
jgi:putative acetyltransferase